MITLLASPVTPVSVDRTAKVVSIVTPAVFAVEDRFWIATANSSIVVCPNLFAIKNFSAISPAALRSSPYFLTTAIIPLNAVVVSVAAPTATTDDNFRMVDTFWNSTPADDILKAVSSSSCLLCPYRTDISLISLPRPFRLSCDTPATELILASPFSNSANASTDSLANLVSSLNHSPAIRNPASPFN